MRFRLIRDTARTGAMNMAIDDLLFRQRPMLRKADHTNRYRQISSAHESESFIT